MIRDDSTELRACVADAGVDPPSPSELDAMFAAVAAETVDRPPGALTRLRELPTAARVAVATAAVLVVIGLAAAVMGVRGDLGGDATARFALALGGVVVLFVGLVAVSLRGIGARPLGWRAWGAIGVALAAPLALAAAPWLWRTQAAGPGAETVFGACGATGLLAGALTAAIVWVFQRDGRGAPWRAFAAVAAGGLTAFVLLQLGCPSTDLVHLVVSHASAGVLLAAGVVVAFGARLAQRAEPVAR